MKKIIETQDHAVCFDCVLDLYLKNIIENEGEVIECSVCGGTTKSAFTVEQLPESNSFLHLFGMNEKKSTPGSLILKQTLA
jgi:hypothetical protein